MKNWDISGWTCQTDQTCGLITQEPLHVMYCCHKMEREKHAQNIIEYIMFENCMYMYN